MIEISSLVIKSQPGLDDGRRLILRRAGRSVDDAGRLAGAAGGLLLTRQRFIHHHQ